MRVLTCGSGVGGGGALVLIAALLLAACGTARTDAPLLSERVYLAWVKRDCLAARQLVEQAPGARPEPAVYLQRVAAGAQEMQREFAAVRPPPRLRLVHRELVRIGAAQLALIETARERLERGEALRAAAELEARNRELVRRANAIAEQLGLAECVNDASAR
ncbi:MAG TPA: hypothetical protein VG474_01015 [Solirubrobacteraceae bacterium]|nr:hypothetical protein [Solirubrobacteraceae bacterium]